MSTAKQGIVLEALDPAIRERVNNWLTGPYDDTTRSEVRELLANGKKDDVIDAFYRDLEFGTGGLRGIMGVGTNRMNKYTIGAATQGLSNYLRKVHAGSMIQVAIAFDPRNNAKEFASIVASVFSANGITVHMFQELRPTPELSFAVRQLKCQAGVMLTASHNPKEYSGYKVYWSDGGQITDPHDRNIIAEVNAITSSEQVKFQGRPDLIKELGAEMDELFLRTIKGVSLDPELKHGSDLKIVYSPIHGTGVEMVPRALRSLGFRDLHLVEEQCVPDGNFPTVIYPNPEESEALTMALKKARQVDADLVMATDPDADRVGIAVKDPSGEFVLLNGNQTGVLLFDYVLGQWERNGRLTGKEYIAKTIVTTYLIDKIAAGKGVKCYNVLTGFKYIGALMTALEGKETFIAGAEESYGYLVGDHVRDKDAVVGCAMIAEMAAFHKRQGRTLFEALMAIHLEHGLYLEELISFTMPGKKGAEDIAALMTSYRNDPPATLGGRRVITVNDYQQRVSRDLTNGSETALELPRSNVMQFITEGDLIISARPSGTEPKIKFYISVNAPLKDAAHHKTLKTELQQLAGAIRKDLIRK